MFLGCPFAGDIVYLNEFIKSAFEKVEEISPLFNVVNVM